MLGLAVGIDYALFIISRYRALARRGVPLENRCRPGRRHRRHRRRVRRRPRSSSRSSRRGHRRAVPGGHGLLRRGTVAIAVLIAITLVPALLGFAGARVAQGQDQGRGAVTGHPRAALGRPRRLTPQDRDRPGHRADRSSSPSPSRTCDSGCPPTPQHPSAPRSGPPVTCSPTGSARASTASSSIVAQHPRQRPRPAGPRQHHPRAPRQAAPTSPRVAPRRLTPDRTLAIIILTRTAALPAPPRPTSSTPSATPAPASPPAPTPTSPSPAPPRSTSTSPTA